MNGSQPTTSYSNPCVCNGCLLPDCGFCPHCQDMVKHGGEGKLKSKCMDRHCKNDTVTMDEIELLHYDDQSVNATYSSQDLSEASSTTNATFDVGSEKPADTNATYQADPGTAVNDATFAAENKAEVVENSQKAVKNIDEILKYAHKDYDKIPPPIQAPRAVNKTDTNQVVDDVDSKPTTKSSRTKQKQIEETATEDSNKSKSATIAADTKRSTRTKAKHNTSTGDEEPAPKRSTRTSQKSFLSSEDDKPASEAEQIKEVRPVRSTRTKQKQLAQSCSDSTLTKEAVSPRVKELAAQALSPAMKQSSSTSRLVGGYTGSPVRDPDGFEWVAQGRKVGSKVYQTYVCQDCDARKLAKKVKRLGFGGKHKTCWIIKYLDHHSC